jgi:peptidoglycan/LPS O-acetylase OafA/YrhL
MGRQFPALGGLAILVVALHHAITLGLEAAARSGAPAPTGVEGFVVKLLFTIGTFAVPIFLFISGSFVAYAARGDTRGLFRSFLSASLMRLWWPYLLWSLVSYVVVFLWKGERHSSLGYAKNLAVGYPFHFVPLLAFFYLLSPVLVRIGRRLPGVLIGAVALYQLTLLCLLHPEAVGIELPQGLKILAPPVLRSTLAIWGICFPLGLVYGLWAPTLLAHLRPLRWAMIAITASLFTVDLLSPLGSASLTAVRVVYSAAFLLLVPLIKRDEIPFAPFLERIGRRAYGIYLTHLNILMLMLLMMERVAPDGFGTFVALIPFLLVPAVGIPLFLMNALSRSRLTLVYRYAFG